MTTPEIWLTDPLPADLEPGVFWLHSSQAPSTVMARYAEDGWATSTVDLEGVLDKAGLMEAFATGLDFPGWVGRNWDALDDALRDLSWWPPGPRGRLVTIKGTLPDGPAAPREHQVLWDVLSSAADRWSTTDSPLVALLWRWPRPRRRLEVPQLPSGRYAVFLRAINTGRRRVKMADLAAAYRAAGYEDVSTFLASGNVVLASAGPPDPAALSEVVADAFDFESEAFVRSRADLRSIVERNPWPGPDALVEVSLLERQPDADTARALEALVEPPEALVVSGTEVFFLREGKGIEVVHKEGTTARMLGQVTTRRGLRTIRDIQAKFFSD